MCCHSLRVSLIACVETLIGQEGVLHLVRVFESVCSVISLRPLPGLWLGVGLLLSSLNSSICVSIMCTKVTADSPAISSASKGESTMPATECTRRHTDRVESR